MPEKEELVELDANELRLLLRAAKSKGLTFDKKRTRYSTKELKTFGFVRESYSPAEIAEKGLSTDGVVTSFDRVASQAKKKLRVGAPFAKKITKWQLPIPLSGIRMMITQFPPNTVVTPHVHPQSSDGGQSGGLRLVLKGSITFNGKKFGPGDWFYIPNGTPYSFVTDPVEITEEVYDYLYTEHGARVRFSTPRRT